MASKPVILAAAVATAAAAAGVVYASHKTSPPSAQEAAAGPQEECYGSERLLADAGAFAGQSASAMSAGLLQKVRAFAGTAPQSDDIAILALRVGRAGEELPQ